MRLKNIVIVVSNIEISKKFYKELFGLEVKADLGQNVVLTEGLVLQEKMVWEENIGMTVVAGGNNCELYFEEYELENVRTANDEDVKRAKRILEIK